MKNSPYASKIKRMSYMLRVVMQVFFWTTLLGMILLVVGAIIVQFLSDDVFIVKQTGNRGFVLSMDNLIRYRIPEASVGISAKPIYKAIAWAAAFCSGGLAIVFRQLTALLKTVEQDKPFAKENAKRLTVIGTVLLLGSIILKITGAMVANTVINTFNVTNLDVNVSIDVFMALSGFMILVLGGVFKYGNYLQEEYDSTL